MQAAACTALILKSRTVQNRRTAVCFGLALLLLAITHGLEGGMYMFAKQLRCDGDMCLHSAGHLWTVTLVLSTASTAAMVIGYVIAIFNDIARMIR